jgi:hypothetical protein
MYYSKMTGLAAEAENSGMRYEITMTNRILPKEKTIVQKLEITYMYYV